MLSLLKWARRAGGTGARLETGRDSPVQQEVVQITPGGCCLRVPEGTRRTVRARRSNAHDCSGRHSRLSLRARVFSILLLSVCRTLSACRRCVLELNLARWLSSQHIVNSEWPFDDLTMTFSTVPAMHGQWKQVSFVYKYTDRMKSVPMHAQTTAFV